MPNVITGLFPETEAKDSKSDRRQCDDGSRGRCGVSRSVGGF